MEGTTLLIPTDNGLQDAHFPRDDSVEQRRDDSPLRQSPKQQLKCRQMGFPTDGNEQQPKVDETYKLYGKSHGSPEKWKAYGCGPNEILLLEYIEGQPHFTTSWRLEVRSRGTKYHIRTYYEKEPRHWKREFHAGIVLDNPDGFTLSPLGRGDAAVVERYRYVVVDRCGHRLLRFMVVADDDLEAAFNHLALEPSYSHFLDGGSGDIDFTLDALLTRLIVPELSREMILHDVDTLGAVKTMDDQLTNCIMLVRRFLQFCGATLQDYRNCVGWLGIYHECRTTLTSRVISVGTKPFVGPFRHRMRVKKYPGQEAGAESGEYESEEECDFSASLTDDEDPLSVGATPDAPERDVYTRVLKRIAKDQMEQIRRLNAS